MALFYSPSEGGFFDDALHKQMPRDAVSITGAEYAELLSQQSQGMEIRAVNGRPAAVRPEAPQVGQAAPSVAPLDFRNRFTPEEKARITLAASSALEKGDPTLQVFLDDVNSAGVVHLDDPRVIGGVEYLVQRGLLSPRRGDTILGR